MKKILFLAVFVFSLILPMASRADGGIMPSPNYWVAESDQKAVIVFENNTETLILSTSFQGSAKDFAWIVPTPAKPQVDKGPVNIFEALDKLTEVSQSGGGIIAPQLMSSTSEKAPSVNVIEQKKIGIYNISVLEANDSNALYNWLKQNNYNYPEYGKTVLDDYIRNKWYFTAVKINSESLNQVSTDLKSGTITPLKLVFSSTKIVYPLKISSITMDKSSIIPLNTSVKTSSSTGSATSISPVPIVPPNQYVSIVLYVFADHKKQADGFTAEYANWVDTKTISNLDFDENGNPWYSPQGGEMYLTKLYTSMNTSDMKSDVFLVNATDNSSIPPSQFWYNVLLTVILVLVILISPFVLLYVIFMLLFILLKSRTAKIVFLLLQGLIILSGILTAAISLLSLSQNYSGTDSGVLPVLISSLIIIIAMIAGLILEIILGKRKKVL